MEIKKEYSCLNKNSFVLHKSITVDKNYQETIEAYLDDIKKILSCKCHTYVTGCDVNNNDVNIMGKTEIKITYFNDSNELLYTDFVEDFSECYTLNDSTEYAFSKAYAFDKYCSFRIINQRRVDVHSTFALDLCVYDKTSCPCISSCDNSKLKVINEKIANVINTAYSKIEVDEEFSISSNSKGIKRIVSFSTQVCPTEIKAVVDKVLIKAIVRVSALYTDNEDNIEKAEYSFEISKIADISGIDQDCCCIVELTEGSLFIKAKSTMDDSGGKIELYGDFYASITAVKEEEHCIVTDGYIVGRKSDNSYSKFDCTIGGECLDKTVDTTFSVDLPCSFSRVLDVSIKPSDFYMSAGKLVTKAEVSFLLENADGEPECVTSTKLLEYDLGGRNDIAMAVFIKSFDFNIVSDKCVNINMSYCFNTYLYSNKELKVLSEINCRDEIVECPALTIYFGKENENLWDIAKNFSSDIALIKKENNICEDCLDSNKVIIIPGI